MEAMAFMANISNAGAKNKQIQNLQAIKQQVDEFMLQRPGGMGMRQVYANHLFSAKPQLHMIYPPFTSKDIKKFEPHFGPVNSVCASPFNRRIFISCSSDGAIRIHDLQGEGGTLISFAPS